MAMEGQVAVRPTIVQRRQPDLSIVIPCLNEASSVGYCVDSALAAVRDAGVGGEVIVADNGSIDGSAVIAEEHGARVVHAPVKGYGIALRKGIEAAEGQFILIGDADGSHDFSELPRFLAKRDEHYELVVGNRFSGEIKPGAMSWSHKHVGNPFLTGMVNLMFDARLGDVYCGMRGFKSDLYDRLNVRATGMEFAVELVVEATKLGAAIAEVPITMWPDRRNRPAHLRSFVDGCRTLHLILRCALGRDAQ